MTQDEMIAAVCSGAAKRVNKGWVQGRMARDANGYSTFPELPDAVEWCLVGSVLAEMEVHYPPKKPAKDRQEVLTRVWRTLQGLTLVGASSLTTWNDMPSRTKEQVVKLLRTAARIARNGKAAPADAIVTKKSQRVPAGTSGSSGPAPKAHKVLSRKATRKEASDGEGAEGPDPDTAGG